MQNRSTGDRDGRGGRGCLSKTDQKAENVLKKQRIECKTVAPEIETVVAAVAICRKRNEKQENVLKKQRIECKTVAPAIRTIAAAEAARLAGRRGGPFSATSVYGGGGGGGGSRGAYTIVRGNEKKMATCVGLRSIIAWTSMLVGLEGGDVFAERVWLQGDAVGDVVEPSGMLLC